MESTLSRDELTVVLPESETCRMLGVHKAVLQLLRVRLIGDVLYLGIGCPSGPITLPF